MKATATRSNRAHGTREVLPWSYPLFGFAAIATLLFVFLSQYANLVRTQYAVVELKSKQHQLQREESALELKIQELTSLERIDRIAVARLKMTVPTQRQVLDLAAWQKARKAAHQVAAVR